jgi:hypothetical protein
MTTMSNDEKSHYIRWNRKLQHERTKWMVLQNEEGKFMANYDDQLIE